ncbi:hypothetical protein HN419_04915 [Candidatus Woesearchaeota archaeon]|nr:hypothetical protein [Candidatus Woesearchaeota archaeon]MBT3537782.1 hypothetical protein [Candidatus Woesearchaeota archaeon]MBT4697913.1 hypothetical protein [Candidatus Woesearchaeota archaeon]MBT4717314.1 hypothetical protein [Candidatus Woesearchaeota archaeon]MBT7105451.1 hypothetical protein [Candidatus Woesearchaeota archaeon]
MKGLEAIAEMEYPGRLIALGRDPTGEHNVVVYAVTGRSPSSQARTLEYNADDNTIFTKPTDPEVLEKGNPDLLLYDAIVMLDDSVAVSNGKQTEAFARELSDDAGDGERCDPLVGMFETHDEWMYEPDNPNYTPRITGVVCDDKGGLGLIVRPNDIADDNDTTAERTFTEFELLPGRGRMVATYTGVNVNPLPSFDRQPLPVEIEGKTPQAVAEAVYEALGPTDPDKDFRVAVAVVFQDPVTGAAEHYIINRHEPGE